MKIAISSGHGKYVRGASGMIDEVTEARRVVDALGVILGDQAVTFHDDTSTNQSMNLETIVDWHNSQDRDLDVSVHFNAYVPTDDGRGTEVLYLTQYDLALEMADVISRASGLINRGAHKRSDLYFLNHTDCPAILIEVCFVDSATDVELYQDSFDRICAAIASLAPDFAPEVASGKVSWFGGPEDQGVAPDEGLAFIYDASQAPDLFLPMQPEGTTGLARRLDPEEFYIAMRWDYDMISKTELASGNYMALVRAPKTGKWFHARPADWGPHGDTDRIADISPGLMEALGIETDDIVEVKFPA